MNPTETRICNILEEHSGRKSVQLSDRILHDLGMWGDDIGEIFDAIAAEYVMDFSNFDFDKHFPAEASFYYSFIIFIHRHGIIKKLSYAPYTALDLTKHVVGDVTQKTSKGPHTSIGTLL